MSTPFQVWRDKQASQAVVPYALSKPPQAPTADSDLIAAIETRLKGKWGYDPSQGQQLASNAVFIQGTATFGYPQGGSGSYPVFGVVLMYPDMQGMVVGYQEVSPYLTLDQAGQQLVVPLQVFASDFSEVE